MGVGRIVANQVLKRAGGKSYQRPGRIQALLRLPNLLRLGLALLRDTRVPVWQKGAVLAGLALVFSPLDWIGDVPLVGQFWDFTLAVTILEFFVANAPADVVDEHITALKLQNKVKFRRR